MDDAAFIEELADGALEWAEALYGTVPPYRDGWAYIHQQDREDWLAGFLDLREPLDRLARWKAVGELSKLQIERFEALLALKSSFDPVIAELTRKVLAPEPARVRVTDDYDLL